MVIRMDEEGLQPPAGKQNGTLDALIFPSRIILYRLKAGGFVSTKKMVLIR